jgi:HEAT repeat protein
MLNDPEANVGWDAAIALAKLGDRSGRGVLLKLLDRNYLSGFSNVDPQAQSRVMQVAIEATAGWNDPQINELLQKLFESDKNMNVRSKAKAALDNNTI